MNRSTAVRIAWCCLAWALASEAFAQTTPRIECLFPAGAARGTEIEVQLEAEFQVERSWLSVAGDGISLRQPLEKNRFRLAIAPDAAPGWREIRLASPQGASAPFPFLIGDLPEVVRRDRKPPELQLPVTVNSRLAASGAIDDYVLTLAAGQQVVCAAEAKAFRSPVEPTLRLLGPDQKQVVASSFAHRSADALLVFRAPVAGRYVLQVYDFQLAGSSQHVYRLTVTNGPWLAFAFPAGVRRNSPTPITLHGWNLPGSSPDAAIATHTLPITAIAGNQHEVRLPGGANRLTLAVGDHPEIVESEPNDSAEAAQGVELPITVNGRISSAADRDWFSLEAKKGDTISIDVDAAENRFPIDAVVAISNEQGKVLVEADDNKTSRDPSLRFKVPLNGRYFVSVRERTRSGGDDFIYRLQMSSPQPDLSVRVNSSSLMAVPGQTTNLPVLVDRVEALAGEFEITAVDLPPGVSVQPQAVPAKTPATVQLPLKVDEKQAPVAGLIRVVARSVPNAKQEAPTTATEQPPQERTALIAETAAATSGSRQLWLAVCPEIPFTLKTGTVILDAPRLAAFPFPVSVQRKEGFTDAIRLVGVEPDKRGTVVPLEGQIAAASDTGAIPLIIQHKVTEGTTHRCRVMGVAEVPGADGKKYPVFHVAAGQMSMGCEPNLLTMSVDPPIVAWRPGDNLRLTVSLMRRVPMESITVRLATIEDASGITCEPVIVSSDQNQATLQLRFAPTATLPPRITATIHAESSRNGLPIYGQASVRLEVP